MFREHVNRQCWLTIEKSKGRITEVQNRGSVPRQNREGDTEGLLGCSDALFPCLGTTCKGTHFIFLQTVYECFHTFLCMPALFYNLKRLKTFDICLIWIFLTKIFFLNYKMNYFSFLFCTHKRGSQNLRF